MGQHRANAENTLREWRIRQNINPATQKQYDAALKAERDGATYEVRSAATEQRKEIEKKAEQETANRRLLGLHTDRAPAPQRAATERTATPDLDLARAQTQFIERKSLIAPPGPDRGVERSRER